MDQAKREQVSPAHIRHADMGNSTWRAKGCPTMLDNRPDTGKPTRRQVLGIFGAAGLAGTAAFASTRSPIGARAQPGAGLWSDPATWGGAEPTPSDPVVVSRPVLLDRDAQVAGLRIEPGGELIFDPDTSHTLGSTGNVEVRGALRMRPGSSAVEHRLEFLGVDESAFVGRHVHQPIGSDVGLWVTDGGTLDLAGSPKTAWTRLTTPSQPGATRISVEDSSGWEVGDQVVVTPTEGPDVDSHWTHHDLRTITALDGDQVALDRPLEHPHPSVTVREGVTHHAEVLNLTRNVQVAGTPEGRAHVIFLHNPTPQHLSYASLRHLGPRQGQDAVEGRYPMHFHLCEDGSRGSTLEGLIARECGNHAFVTHLSHGVSLRDCVSHDTYEDPFWWDDPASLGVDDDGIPTHDVVYDRCVAHNVKPGPGSRYNLAGFFLGAGRGNVARDCVAVGVQGDARSASGFHWPEHSKDQNTWTFEDNLAHNLERSGIYFWQNVVPRTIVDRFTAYHCATGIYAGAYSNLVSYRDCTIYRCGEQGMLIAAVPESPQTDPDETITYERIYVDQANLTDHAVELLEPGVGSSRTVYLIECTFKGGNVSQLRFDEEHGRGLARVYELVDCVFEGNELWMVDGLSPKVVARMVHTGSLEMVVRPAGQEGQLRRDWNASVS